MVVMNSLIVDCGSCRVRGAACSDCVITVLLGGPVTTTDAPAGHGRHEFNEAEQAAVAALSSSGLVPPLRLVDPAFDAVPCVAPPRAAGE